MERLTEWNGEQTRHAYYPRCFKEPCYGSGCKIKDCPFETEVCECLTAYEDIAELCGGIDRLRELVEADKDGRVIVLPAKKGDTWKKAMSILDKKYAEAKKLPFIRDPLAWALYHTWKEFDDGKRCD